MQRFLLFTLYAPLAACGEIAVGEHRASWARPGKSAVLGLVAAALGITRADEKAHSALAGGYGYAVRVDAPGRPLEDFHTAEVPRARRDRRWATRREELAACDEGDSPIVSRRGYLTDTLFTAALWPQEQSPRWSPERIAEALAQPAFTPYLGRKSCPLGLPLAPEIIEAETLPEALARRSAWPLGETPLPSAGAPMLYADLGAPGLTPAEGRIERRRDALWSRRRWQFAEREEVALALDPPVKEMQV